MAEAGDDKVAGEASAVGAGASSPSSGSKDGARSSSDTAARTTNGTAETAETADTEVEDDGKMVECLVDGCHEVVELAEMVYHLDLHTALDYQKEADKADKTDKIDKANRPQSGDSAHDRRRRRRKDSHHGHRRKDSSSSASKNPTAIGRTASHTSRHTHRSHRLSRVGNEEDGTPQNHHRERRDRERSRSRGHRHKHSHSHSHHDRSSRGDRDKDGARSRPTTHDDRAKEPQAAPATPDTPPHTATRPKSSRLNWWPFRFASELRKPTHHHLPVPPVSRNGNAAAANGAPAPPKTRKRLGRAELGKYAHEERMPEWLAVYLKKEWGVCHSGTIPVLHHMLEQSSTTEYAYLCDPCVMHVSRLPKEGGFCGYRNIQTMVSYIMGAKFPGYNLFGEDLPSIFDVQNIIENAWDMGINAQGRIETGGIRWTRKYIGTPEAMAMFRSLNIPCNAQAFNHVKAGRAADMLAREVERYFQAGKPLRPGNKVRATSLPPIYLQHPGHSLTIVGIEKTTTGQVNLLVFDPVIRHGWPLLRLPGMRSEESPERVLKLYRRGPRYLYKYRAFEILRLDPKPKDLRPIEGISPVHERRVESVSPPPPPERHTEDSSAVPDRDVNNVSPLSESSAEDVSPPTAGR